MNHKLWTALAFAPWLLVFSFLVWDTWFICEDAFIAFRYVRNLVEGRGLVFNAEERVEGYVHVLWILELGSLWSWFGWRPEWTAGALSLTFTALTLLATVRLATRGPITTHRWLTAWMATGLLACSTTFAVWSSGGLETREFTLLVLLGVALLASHSESHSKSFLGSVVFGAAALTRPEGLLLWGCCVAGCLMTSRRARSLGGLAMLCVPFAVIVGGHFVFRYSYYGEWLPNPYYAKHVRSWYEAGSQYVSNAALETGLYAMIPLAAFAAWRHRSTSRGRMHFLTLMCVVPHAWYLAHIGGDHFENRPMDFYWPLLALASADALIWAGGTARRFVTVVAFVVFLAYASGLQGSIWYLSRKLDTREATTQLCVDVRPTNAPLLFWLPGMAKMSKLSTEMRFANTRQLIGLRAREHHVYAVGRVWMWSGYERMHRGILPPDAVTATRSAGVMPFYLPELTVIDLLGLVDRDIARTGVTVPNTERMLAHDRKPPPGYLAARGVNMYVQSPAKTAEQALARAEYALKVGDDLWLPFESTDLAWVDRAFAGKELRRRQ